MHTTAMEKKAPSIQTLYIFNERQIAAPIDVVFETVMHPPGHFTEMSLKLEAWPGGRWYRDLGNNSGHLWGHVQVIKPPTLLEIVGPMFMSYAVSSHLQYRLKEVDGGTYLTLLHQAIGLITPDHLEGVTKGWGQMMDQIKSKSENNAGKR
jgi:uncharacterized protein YndB with AHSA1/START domain